MTVELVTMPEQELAIAGVHHLRTGDTEITTSDLEAAVQALSDPAVLAPRVKLAHEHQLDTGEPSFGVYENVHLSDDKRKLLGTPTGVPKWLAQIWPSAFPNRSIEGPKNWTSPSGRTHALVIEAVGMLGVKMPGIKGLNDLKTWYGGSIPESVVLAAYGEAVNVPTTKEQTVPFSKAMLDKLGLAEDASDDVVLAKIDALELAAKGDPEAIKKQVADALAAEKTKLESEAQAAAQKTIDEARAAAQTDAVKELEKKGFKVVEASALETITADAKAGADLAKETAAAKRVQVIEAAINDGKIAPAKKDDMVRALESGAIDEAFIEGLPSVVPVEARGKSEEIEASGKPAARDLSVYTDAEIARLKAAGVIQAA